MDENVDVECLLREWGLESYIPSFKENNITSMAMALLGYDEIKELFPSIGHRVLFTKNLAQYKKVVYQQNENNSDNTSIFGTQLSDITIDSVANIQDIQEFPFNELIALTTEASGSTENQRDDKCLTEKNERLTLTKLLESTLEGKALLSISKSNPLENASRMRLVRLIGTHILKTHPERNITADIYNYWANEIVQLYTSEKRAVYLHTKLVESTRGIANRLVGKLPDQIHNLKRKYRDSGIISKRIRTDSPKTPCSSPCSSSLSPSSPVSRFQEINFDLEGETDCEESLQWLKNSSHPWESVEQKWEETSRARMLHLKDMSIDQYYNEYPALQKPTGYLLLLNDFKTIYPSNFKGLFENFPTYKGEIFKIAANRPTKDKYIKNLLSLENTSEEVSNLAAFLLLPSLLSVSSLRLKGTVKKVWRPSKSEVRDAFILHVVDDAHVEEQISHRQDKLRDFNLTLQPFIIVVGESLNNIKTHFVIVNKTKYCLPSIIEAVDACLKIIFTLNAKYPEESSCVWMLIQQGFFKIKTTYDRTQTATSTLLAELGICE